MEIISTNFLTTEDNERKYSGLFHLTPAPVFIWEPNSGRILKVNAAAKKDYGYTSEELSVMTIYDLKHHHNCCTSCSTATLHPSEDGRSYVGTRKHRSKNGKDLWLDFSSYTVIFKDERCVLSLGVNITEQRMLQQSLDKEKARHSREITQAVITAQEQERESIGRELHDNVNQVLASSRFYISMLRKQLPASSEHLEETDKLVMHAIDELRSLSHALVLPSLKKEDFMAALDDIIYVTSLGSDIIIHKEVTGLGEKKISEKIWLTVFRIIQEQLSNIRKYAEATHVWLQLDYKNGVLSVRIRDNGKGFDPAAKATGVGLMNIKTRASLNNGEAQVVSAFGKGCTLTVNFNVD